MSYAATAALAPDNSTDANFRAWGSAISAKFASMGLVNTTDTGQINWTTVTHPTTTNAKTGYEIWRFNDTLQSTVPLYLKIEYGSGGAANAPTLWISIGSGSNGSGTLTGQLGWVQAKIGTSNANSTSTKNCVFSGDTGRVGMALWTDFSTGACAWFIERTKNTDGTDSSLGFLFAFYASSADSSFARAQQFIPATGAVPGGNTDNNIFVPFGVTGGAYGSDTAVYPFLVNQGGSFLNAGMSHLGYFPADITRDVTFTMTIYGATHTYYPLGGTSNLATCFRGNSPSGGTIAMRYE